MSALTVLGVMGEGGEGRHRGRDPHSGPWTLPSVACIVAVPVSMVPGWIVGQSQGRSVSALTVLGVMGEG